MDLEIHDVPTELRPQFTQRLKTYKKELDRLRKEFVRQRMLPHDLSFDSSPPVLINVISLIIFCGIQRQSQVAVGDDGMRGELFRREELHTSEDQVSHTLRQYPLILSLHVY